MKVKEARETIDRLIKDIKISISQSNSNKFLARIFKEKLHLHMRSGIPVLEFTKFLVDQNNSIETEFVIHHNKIISESIGWHVRKGNWVQLSQLLREITTDIQRACNVDDSDMSIEVHEYASQIENFISMTKEQRDLCLSSLKTRRTR